MGCGLWWLWIVGVVVVEWVVTLHGFFFFFLWVLFDFGLPNGG